MCTGHQYVSCVKLGGQPILPPLITPKRREECLKYKIQAIEVEKKKERNRLFRKCMEDLASLERQTKDLSHIEEKEKQLNSTLESQLAFAEDNTLDSPSHVPYSTFKKLQNLTSETIDVSEYSNEGVRVLSRGSNDDTEVKTPTSKLIRSNSYTLDSPSPILLAHLEKEARKCAELSEAESRSLSPVTVIDSESVHLVETEVQEVTVTLEPQLKAVLDRLPPDHAANIADIWERQREENRKNRRLVEEAEPTSVSICSSQSLYYSLGSPELRVVNLKDARREWAASVIGAAARGYLVRRLIRTEKVQSLIETIKDALLCAIQLHGAEVIEEADVELHRRLIQQVSAACYAFHDVFFSLSVKEQMNIIAKDRQRRKDKANRPPSSASSNISIHRRRRSSKAIR